MDKTFTIETHPERVDGPNQRWNVAAGDWRDADLILPLGGAQLYPVDAEPRGAEPDWSQGWSLRWGERDFIEVPPDRPVNPNTRMYFRGTGEPPEILKRAYLEGRVLFGVIVARDLQQHNA